VNPRKKNNRSELRQTSKSLKGSIPITRRYPTPQRNSRYVQPQPSEPKVATLRSRIITSPAHMKRIFRALEDNINQYEKQFGEIKESAPAVAGETTLVQ